MKNKGKLPVWLKRPAGGGEIFRQTMDTLRGLGQETICTNANCPNLGECWSRGTATVLILGNVCTRNCRFCSVGNGKPLPPDENEPGRVAELASKMKLKYLVITSVDRDDLSDGGAGHFAKVIKAVRGRVDGIRFEILVPDFKGCQDMALEQLDEVRPFVFGHNVETVPDLYHIARTGGDYELSLKLLRKAKEMWGDEIATKSSLMLGLGETDEQVERVLKDLLGVGCDRLTIGQYLRPSRDSLEVAEYVTPEKFDWWGKHAKEMGFKWVMSSPFTRSSYFAEKEI